MRKAFPQESGHAPRPLSTPLDPAIIREVRAAYDMALIASLIVFGGICVWVVLA